MKRNLFNTKTTEAMAYLQSELPSDTYWCEDMMQMLLYLVDWKASLELGQQVTDLDWKTNGAYVLEAENLEEVHYWERFVPALSWKEVIKRRWFSSSNHLSEEEIEILDHIVEKKKEDDFRVGSYAFRKFVHSTDPLQSLSSGDDQVIYLDFPKTSKSQSLDEKRQPKTA